MGTVVGLFETRDQAVKAVESLKAAGFPAEDMSIVMRDREASADVAEEAGVGDAAAAGAMGGGLLGGIAGLVLGAGALAIPGIGPIIAAGPIAAALTGGALGAAAGGIVGALTEVGVPEDEVEHYQAGVERGGVLLSVKVPAGRESEARSLLTSTGLHDIKHHQKLWKKDPDYRYDAASLASTPTADTSKPKAKAAPKAATTKGDKTMATTNKHEDTKATVSTATGGAAGALAGAGVGAAVGGPVGAAVGAGIGAVAGSAAGGAAGYASHEADFRSEWESSSARGKHRWEEVSPAYRYGWESYERPEYRDKSWSQVGSELKKSWTGSTAWEETEPYVKSAWERRAKHQVASGNEAVIPVVEEELKVGKRTVEKGGVQVKTSVVETPVETDVSLHEEHVKVKRRAVDRPVTGADAAAFQEGTIELKETVEEAVVAKSARVVEEIVLSKEGSDRTQTVRDKVRKTDVDVQEIDTPATVTHETYETFSPQFEKHHKSHYAKGGSTYSEYTPAYRFGHTLGTDERYRTGTWATVEPEARRHWETKNEGTWEEFKDAVHHAWDKARGKA
ncbi:DUF2382 domain-containing protein [Tundrisphaera sp. TA3]|uniref:DUF2382 domain-containing protein n=1 Tax=Tundrisphaera sp. TA3 TaxID=3435775 RepID=UPI003EBAC231